MIKNDIAELQYQGNIYYKIISQEEIALGISLSKKPM